jgi:hypothetical protein
MQRGSSSLGSKYVRSCLISLAKLHGPALSSQQERQEHIFSFIDNLELSLSTIARSPREFHELGPHALHLATLTHTLLHELRITSGLGLLCQTPSLTNNVTLAWKFLLSAAPYEEESWYWDGASHFAATWSLVSAGLRKMDWDPLARNVLRSIKMQGTQVVASYISGRLLWAERQILDEDEEMNLEMETKDWVHVFGGRLTAGHIRGGVG